MTTGTEVPNRTAIGTSFWVSCCWRYTLNFVDRSIIGIIGQSIKVDLLLSDTQLGLLGGLAFALLYTSLGIPIARVAERANRVNLISISILIWSGCTALCGLAQNFWSAAAFPCGRRHRRSRPVAGGALADLGLLRAAAACVRAVGVCARDSDRLHDRCDRRRLGRAGIRLALGDDARRPARRAHRARLQSVHQRAAARVGRTASRSATNRPSCGRSRRHCWAVGRR